MLKAFTDTLEVSTSHWNHINEMYSDIRQGEHEMTDQVDQHIKILVEKCSYKNAKEKKTRWKELLFYATKHFEVKKWVRSQTAKKETVTFDNLLQYVKEHEATVRDFNHHKSNRGVGMATTIDEIRSFKFRKGNGQRAKGGPGRHVANLTPLENAQHGARNVTSVVIKITSVHVVGPNSQETGTGDTGADPKDTKARVNHLVQGLEANP